MRNAGLEEVQTGIKIAGRNIHNLRYADDTTLMAESEEELKSLLIEVKEASEKVGLKLSVQKTKIMASSSITSWLIDGETVETVLTYFSELQNHCRSWLQPWNKKTLVPWKKSYDQPRQHIQKQRHDFANKSLSSHGYGFSSSQVWMWELDDKESWVLKNWCFWTVVLVKTLESPWVCKIKPVHPKGDQSWVLIERTGVEAENPILWPPHVKSWLIGKDPDIGKDLGQEKKGTTEDEIVGCIINSTEMSLRKVQELVMDRKACWAAVRRVTKSQTWLSNWTEFNSLICGDQWLSGLYTLHNKLGVINMFVSSYNSHLGVLYIINTSIHVVTQPRTFVSFLTLIKPFIS